MDAMAIRLIRHCGLRSILGMGLCTIPLLAQTEMPAPSAIATAIADPARPAADTAFDGNRKPAALIAFAGIGPRDRVADLMPGGGYFTRIFSKLVGRRGHVYAIVPTPFAEAKPERLAPIRALVAGSAYSNVTLAVRPFRSIAVAKPLDAVWTSQNYHDVYGAAGANEAAALDAAVFAALKPGGVYLVIDHAAQPGSGGRDAKTLHRIDPATVVEQARTAGFVLEARSDVLANPQDGHTAAVFAPEIEGRTDKFVLKFRKPRA